MMWLGAGAALVALATAPLSAAPSPQALRAALADPVDKSFVEAPLGTQGTLEGPFDINAYVDYYRATGASESDVQSGLHYLRQDGFVGGYGRQWYRPGQGDYLGELVLVFGGNGGAVDSEHASKLRYEQDTGFRSEIDSGLSAKEEFASTMSYSGYEWTVVMFVKGNALYAISRGSTTDSMTSGALAQAQSAYTVAPAGIAVQVQPAATSIARYVRLALIVGLIVLLGVAAAVATIFVLVRRPGTSPHSAEAGPLVGPIR